MIGFEFYASEVKVGNVLHVSETFAYVKLLAKEKNIFSLLMNRTTSKYRKNVPCFGKEGLLLDG